MFKIFFANLHLEKILWIIKSKILYIIMFALVGGAVGGAYALFMGQDLYRSEITMTAFSNPDYANDSGININVSDVQSAQQLITSYSSVLTSSIFLNDVLEASGLQDQYSVLALQRRISARQITNTSMFVIYVVDPNPMNAQLIANTIGEIAPTRLVGLVKSGGLQVLDEAKLPTEPYESTSTILFALIGAVGFGVMSAVGFLFFGLQDTRIRRKYEVEDMFNIPIIGTVPLVESTNKVKKSPILGENSSFEMREAYNEIRTFLTFSKRDEKCPVYGILSADKGEGKTVSALNIASSLANTGKKILFIDADLRESRTAEVLGMSGTGLSEYLGSDEAELNIQRSGRGFDVILAGAKPSNAADLLAGGKIRELINAQKENYDMIIVDLAPAGRVIDGLELADCLASYVLVVREMVTKFEREEMIIRNIEELKGDICGFIYNGISTKSEDYNYKKAAEKYGFVDTSAKVVSAKKKVAAR